MCLDRTYCASTFSISRFLPFFSFFFQRMNSKITWIYCAEDNYHCSHIVAVLFTHCSNIVHAFKNIITVFLVFSFNKNKLYPNGP